MITRVTLRRLERLERAQSQPRDVGTCPAPSLEPETLRQVLRMLAESGVTEIVGAQGRVDLSALFGQRSVAQQQEAGDS